ncbi:MAG TPA: hypothetical protein VMW00_06360 [Dehalococcoidales bacterium]|nr:hypothetical protein [Dehalococcoidales bacterium]
MAINGAVIEGDDRAVAGVIDIPAYIIPGFQGKFPLIGRHIGGYICNPLRIHKIREGIYAHDGTVLEIVEYNPRCKSSRGNEEELLSY